MFRTLCRDRRLWLPSGALAGAAIVVLSLVIGVSSTLATTVIDGWTGDYPHASTHRALVSFSLPADTDVSAVVTGNLTDAAPVTIPVENPSNGDYRLYWHAYWWCNGSEVQDGYGNSGPGWGDYGNGRVIFITSGTAFTSHLASAPYFRTCWYFFDAASELTISSSQFTIGGTGQNPAASVDPSASPTASNGNPSGAPYPNPSSSPAGSPSVAPSFCLESLAPDQYGPPAPTACPTPTPGPTQPPHTCSFGPGFDPYNAVVQGPCDEAYVPENGSATVHAVWTVLTGPAGCNWAWGWTARNPFDPTHPANTDMQSSGCNSRAAGQDTDFGANAIDLNGGASGNAAPAGGVWVDTWAIMNDAGWGSTRQDWTITIAVTCTGTCTATPGPSSSVSPEPSASGGGGPTPSPSGSCQSGACDGPGTDAGSGEGGAGGDNGSGGVGFGPGLGNEGNIRERPLGCAIDGFVAHYPKVGMLGYVSVSWPATPEGPAIPGTDFHVPDPNLFDWIPWLGAAIGYIVGTLLNFLITMWNLLVDLAVPSNCLGDAVNAFGVTVSSTPPFSWFTAMSGAAQSAFTSETTAALPSLHLGTQTIALPLTEVGDAVAPYRGMIKSVVFLFIMLGMLDRVMGLGKGS